mmetsp:Transcript_21601/g.64750  ORF Transcript_21601/g.64750 Transcript_21601/m.64750 type:complete len:201 (+) Transcript_21601:810-1412(+)
MVAQLRKYVLKGEAAVRLAVASIEHSSGRDGSRRRRAAALGARDLTVVHVEQGARVAAVGLKRELDVRQRAKRLENLHKVVVTQEVHVGGANGLVQVVRLIRVGLHHGNLRSMAAEVDEELVAVDALCYELTHLVLDVGTRGLDRAGIGVQHHRDVRRAEPKIGQKHLTHNVYIIHTASERCLCAWVVATDEQGVLVALG